MKKIKLTKLTATILKREKIKPVDVEDYTEQSINENYPEVELLHKFKRPQGTLIKETDEVLFRLCCRDEEDFNLSDKRWIEVDGEFYDVEVVIRCLEQKDYEVENDL